MTAMQRRGLWVPPLILVVAAAAGWWITHSNFNAHEIVLSIWLSRHQSQPWSGLFAAIAVILSPLGAPLLALLAAAVAHWRRGLRAAVRLLAFTGAGWGFAAPIKPLVARPRPNGALLFDPISPQVGHLSFPSGHTAFAAAFACAVVLVTLPRARRHVGFVVGCVAVAVVALSRIYVGAHFLTDVTAGAILGACGVWFAFSLEQWWLTRNQHTLATKTVSAVSKEETR